MQQEKKKAAAGLQLHSDQGLQCSSHAYFQQTQSYGITPSMSRRGNPFDSAMADNHFSILKTKCLYRHNPDSFKAGDAQINTFIHFCNHERIQSKTGAAPLSLRYSLSLSFPTQGVQSVYSGAVYLICEEKR